MLHGGDVVEPCSISIERVMWWGHVPLLYEVDMVGPCSIAAGSYVVLPCSIG